LLTFPYMRAQFKDKHYKEGLRGGGNTWPSKLLAKPRLQDTLIVAGSIWRSALYHISRDFNGVTFVV
jgi:hypothetical protein